MQCNQEHEGIMRKEKKALCVRAHHAIHYTARKEENKKTNPRWADQLMMPDSTWKASTYKHICTNRWLEPVYAFVYRLCAAPSARRHKHGQLKKADLRPARVSS